MTTTATVNKTARHLSFAEVASAMNLSNICSYIQEEYEQFLATHGLKPEEVLPMANHSLGGRQWKWKEGITPLFFKEDTFNGGWHIVTEDDAHYLECESATSGSRLCATLERAGTWTLTLEVPMKGNTPYKGCYWEAFHDVVGNRVETKNDPLDEYDDVYQANGW